MMNLKGSFWSTAYDDSHNITSNIDNIMDRIDYTLDDILVEDDVIQECKILNLRLIEYLCTPDITRRLISMFINEPATDAHEREKTKFPYVASEIFTCDVKDFSDVFFDNNNEYLLDELFSFLDQARPLHPTRAGYWRKVVTVLCIRKYDDLMVYLTAHPVILSKFLNHIDTNSVTEVLIALSWSNSIGIINSHDLTWFAEQNLIEKLIDLMHPSNDSISHLNTSRVLSDLIIKSPINQTNPLLARLQNVELLELLFSYILSGSGSCLTHGLMIVINLLNRSLLAFSAPPPEDASLLDPCISKPPIYTVTLNHLSNLTALLKTAPTNSLATQFGVLNPPLGEKRYHLVELMQALFKAALPSTYTGIPPPASPADAQIALAAAHTASSEAAPLYELYMQASPENQEALYNDIPLFAKLQAALLNEKCLEIILDLFFEYSFHSLLHGVVDKMVYPIIVEGTPEMQHELFIKCTFMQRLLTAYQDNEKILLAPKGIRRGHIGFLTRFCNAIHEIIKLDGDLACFKDDATWLAVEAYLNNENDRASVLLGGEIPDMNIPSNVLDAEENIFSASGLVSQFLPSYNYGANEFGMDDNYDSNESLEYGQHPNSYQFDGDNSGKPLYNESSKYWADFENQDKINMNIEEEEELGFDPDYVKPFSFAGSKQNQNVVFNAQSNRPAFEQNDEVMFDEDEDFTVHSAKKP